MKSWILALVVILAGVLACTGLAGCGDDEEDGETRTVTVTNEVGEVIVVEVPVDDADGTPGTGDPDVWFEEDDVPVAERPALEAPSLIWPEDGAAFRTDTGSVGLTFTWSSVYNAEYYLIMLRSPHGVAFPDQVEGTSYSFTATVGNWTWQVGAVRGDLREWTGMQDFVVTTESWIPTD